MARRDAIVAGTAELLWQPWFDLQADWLGRCQETTGWPGLAPRGAEQLG